MRNIAFFFLILPVVAVGAICLSVPLADFHWTFDLLAQLLQPAFVLGVVGTLVALALRRWRIAAVGAAVGLTAFAIAWPWTVSEPPIPEGITRVRVLQYNMWARNTALDRLPAAIEAVDADIVILLEVMPKAREKLRELDAHYPQRFECWQSQHCDGLVLSRLPIRDPHADTLGPPDHSPIAWFETTLDGCAVNIFLTHLTRPFPHLPVTAQFTQADDVAAALRGWPGPKIVIGDFNGVPWGHVVKTVANQANLHVSLGSGGTWPSILPPPLRLPIDHLMATEGIAVSGRKVLGLPGSDHDAVLTEVAIADRSRCW